MRQRNSQPNRHSQLPPPSSAKAILASFSSSVSLGAVEVTLSSRSCERLACLTLSIMRMLALNIANTVGAVFQNHRIQELVISCLACDPSSLTLPLSKRTDPERALCIVSGLSTQGSGTSRWCHNYQCQRRIYKWVGRVEAPPRNPQKQLQSPQPV
jgi:hypothetical protein